jgi:hypothetical protein
VAEFTDVTLLDDTVQFTATQPHGSPDEQTFEEAVKRDPIALARVVVGAIRASGQRREHFNRIILDGNANDYFVVGEQVVKIPSLQLLRDVKTRWDSIYYMVQRLRIMRPVSYQSAHTVSAYDYIFRPLIRFFLSHSILTLHITASATGNGLSFKTLKLSWRCVQFIFVGKMELIVIILRFHIACSRRCLVKRPLSSLAQCLPLRCS